MSAHHCSLFEAHPGAVEGRHIGAIDLGVLDELADQWRIVLADAVGGRALSSAGDRMLVLATGPLTSTARSFAALREEAKLGATDAMPADEPRIWRDWDQVIAISQSGDEPEVLHALRHLPPRVPRTVIASSDAARLLPFADDVVTMPAGHGTTVEFETTVLVAARSAFGSDLSALPARVEAVLADDVPVAIPGVDHVAFVGAGWASHLAQRSAHVLGAAREIRAEAHAPRDALYGGIDHADGRSLIWFLGKAHEEVLRRVTRTGATVTASRRDPLVDYVAIHRMTAELGGSQRTGGGGWRRAAGDVAPADRY